MVKGDIVLYKHREGQEFYGVIKQRVSLEGFSVDVLTNAPAQNWAAGFICHVKKLEVVERVNEQR